MQSSEQNPLGFLETWLTPEGLGGYVKEASLLEFLAVEEKVVSDMLAIQALFRDRDCARRTGTV
jgi:hypothetical protein